MTVTAKIVEVWKDGAKVAVAAMDYDSGRLASLRDETVNPSQPDGAYDLKMELGFVPAQRRGGIWHLDDKRV